MHLQLLDTPREFQVKGHSIKDLGKVQLEDGEMLTFLDPEGRECDFVAKKWGFYLGPSLNDRLSREGFKVALVLNEQGQIYVNAVNKDRVEEFSNYLKTGQNNTLLCWLDEWVPDRKGDKENKPLKDGS